MEKGKRKKRCSSSDPEHREDARPRDRTEQTVRGYGREKNRLMRSLLAIDCLAHSIR